MQTKNPLNITNSELAEVEQYQSVIKDIFDKKFSKYSARKQFYTNINTIARFSIARQFSKKKTIQMWEKWVQWYQDYKPDQISQKEQIIGKIHTSGKYRFCGKDKSGCPVLIIQMRYHIKGMATAQQNLKYLLYMIEKGVRLCQQAKTYQLSIIYDRRDMQESDQVSKQSMKKFMPLLNDYYPERLKSFYVLGANIFYRAMWKIVSIFVSKRTQTKINLLEEEKNLQQFIDRENLAKRYGGILQIQDTNR